MNTVTSRLDAQIARKEFTDQGISPIWEDLWTAVQQTVHKLNTHYASKLTAVCNSGGTLIQVGALLDVSTNTQRSMEINLRRSERKIIVRCTKDPTLNVWDSPISFSIKANVDEGQLFFESDTIPLTAIALAEHILAEQMLGLNLDS